MRGFKYITYEGALCDEIVLFPEVRDHAQFAHQLGVDRKKILGAGFVRMSPDNPPQCWGESISLKVSSRGLADTTILHRMAAYAD